MRALGKLLRLNLLPKTFLIMALGWHQAGGHGYAETIPLLAAAASVATTWAGLYAFNHWADRREDAADPQYRDRPLVSGAMQAWQAFWLSALLTAAGVGMAFATLRGLGLITLGMVTSQVLYCGAPFRLKHVPFLDLLLVDIVNPWLRFAAGSVVVSSALALPPLPLAALAFLHLGSTLSQKLLTRDRDLRLGRPGTGTLLTPPALRISSAISTVLGLSCVILMSLSRQLGLPSAWGSLPPPTLWLVAGYAVAAPLWIRVLGRPSAYSIERVRTVAWRVFAVAAAFESIVLLRFPR